MLIRQRECHSYYRDIHYYLIICPDRCLLIGYDASRCDEKMNMLTFRRSQIEVESQSNHNCSSCLMCDIVEFTTLVTAAWYLSHSRTFVFPASVSPL